MIAVCSIMHISECKLDSREPISHARQTSLEPILLLIVSVSPISYSSFLSTLVPGLVELLGILSKRNTKYHTTCFQCSSLAILLILSLSILSIPTGWIRIFDFLSTHRTIFTAALNQLNDAELMENMPTWQFSSSNHLLLTYSAIFRMLNCFLNGISTRVDKVTLNVLFRPRHICIYNKFDLREVFFQVGHKYGELEVLLKIGIHFA